MRIRPGAPATWSFSAVAVDGFLAPRSFHSRAVGYTSRPEQALAELSVRYVHLGAPGALGLAAVQYESTLFRGFQNSRCVTQRGGRVRALPGPTLSREGLPSLHFFKQHFGLGLCSDVISSCTASSSTCAGPG